MNQYTEIELLTMEFDYLVTTVDSCADLGDDELLDQALHDLEVFRENYAPEMPEILKLWDGGQQ